ncbi:uncharacterized protein Z520_11591 [Fonsecaea multimorphosa CBS 102226]|uniref:Uncharacterized protein n=1 Tax=Fonsecaea multimorphosa CBS 102226 TaxID=1442371 RepID=A0A0D2JQH6_9EURO|nr:uncharacterized protein Z520_11591 [Fonsecaea multimorphosa CBS 102226]KIX92739.1 hypothetical protein Z520_11591 [Fonsecaea multimorphosa CBS 102226]OAL17981.1 hypothetical protein AYO22_11137 [Fonsecaea multimorphosa]
MPPLPHLRHIPARVPKYGLGINGYCPGTRGAEWNLASASSSKSLSSGSAPDNAPNAAKPKIPKNIMPPSPPTNKSCSPTEGSPEGLSDMVEEYWLSGAE